MASGHRLLEAEAKLGRIRGIEHSHTVLQVFDVLLVRVAGCPEGVQLVHDDGHHQLAELEHVGSLLWVSGHASPHSRDQKRAVVVLIDRLVLSVDDFLGDGEWVAGAEGLGESDELVDDAPKRPNVGLFGVGLGLDDFGARVEDSSHERLHHACRLSPPALGQAEVRKLHVEVSINEHISRGQVSVDDAFFHVQVAQGSA